MKIAVLGTKMVGTILGSKLVELGHEVCMGSRTPDNEDAVAWAAGAGEKASHGTFKDAAAIAEVVINCVNGLGTMNALEMAGAENLSGKILIDLSNPLDFSNGMPPTLFVSNTDSLGEQVQRAYPDAKVVKTFNTLTSTLMVAPDDLPGDHVIFLNGNDEQAKQQVKAWFGEWFGWKPGNIIDMGDITTARGTEAYLALWIRLYQALGTAEFNINIVRK